MQHMYIITYCCLHGQIKDAVSSVHYRTSKDSTAYSMRGGVEKPKDHEALPGADLQLQDPSISSAESISPLITEARAIAPCGQQKGHSKTSNKHLLYLLISLVTGSHSEEQFGPRKVQ